MIINLWKKSITEKTDENKTRDFLDCCQLWKEFPNWRRPLFRSPFFLCIVRKTTSRVVTLTNWRMLQIFFKFFSNLDFVTFWLVLKFFRSEQKRQVVKHHYITFHWLDSSDQKFNIIRIKSLIQNGFDGLFNALLSKSYHFSKATLFCDHHDHHRYWLLFFFVNSTWISFLLVLNKIRCWWFCTGR